MILTTPQGIDLTTYTPGEAFFIAGQVANQQAPYHELNDYRQRKAAQTLRRQAADVARFAGYVDTLAAQTQPHAAALAANLRESRDALQQFAHNLRDTDAVLDLNAWTGLTYGHLLQYRQSLLEQGYSLRTVNFSLSTLRTYATFAGLAGVIEAEQMALIKATSGYSTKEFTRIDEKREVDRRGYKKQKAVLLSPEQALRLKHQQPLSVPQVRRDNLLLCLLLDHGLRASEAATVKVDDIDLARNKLVFYRPKTGEWGRHTLTVDTRQAAELFLENDAPQEGRLLRGSYKSGVLSHHNMSERAITARVKDLGEHLLQVESLSAHDCRHYAATTYAEQGKSINVLMEIFGWKSPAMAIVYVESVKTVELE